MKQSTLFITILLLFTVSTFAQQRQSDPTTVTISANYSYSDPSLYGISAEFSKNKFGIFSQHTSTVLNISMSRMNYDNNLVEVQGTGFAVELGHRFYKTGGRKSGVYIQWLLAYSNTEFDEDTPLGHFDGKYSYWSLLNNDIGYKIKIGNNFSIDPSLGYNWKWEVAGKGDIDNIYSDNFVFRCGIKMGISF
ncbi:hypothetical protein [Flavobacterium gilvum]|uniref:DUF3575 domain-containing protein n=1 Tax=Flavobacterium gilvum TaxID=1492737 RepID=A0AAC9N555_9FLAO|nr:hypothetical protein [Flavobacterium gilvum]AOW09236.1 hypothetical protein EM308_06785 [Flavobacterium gilvum]